MPEGSETCESEARESTLHRAISMLEFVAAAGSLSAKEIAEGTGLPVPTVYRLATELCELDYLIHLKREKRFALGYRLHQLAVGLHSDLGIAPEMKREIATLHASTRMAAYLAIHRGSDYVVVFVADSPVCPRIKPMTFGFRDCPHATAFGKLGLSEMTQVERNEALAKTGMPRLTKQTITNRVELDVELEKIRHAGVAWEHEEFQDGVTCAAVPMRSASGILLGSVAVSAPTDRYRGQIAHVEHLLRSTAAIAGRYYRLGAHAGVA